MKTVIFFLLLMSGHAHAVTDFQLNGVTTPVKKDTSTPANSKGLPVQQLNTSGVQVDLATEATLQSVDTTLSTLDGKVNNDFGVSTGAVRSAAQVGNATGAADFGSGNLSAQTLRTVIATDQPAIPTQAPVNTTGVYDEITNLTTVAQTFTVPANAVGFLIETLSSNTVNIRYKIGAVATTTSGVRLEPGRSEYLPLAANVSVIAESGTNQAVTLQWVVK